MQEHVIAVLRERFWKRVTVGSEDECWDWTGHCWASGYGCINVDHQRYRVHRVAYELSVGPIPEGMLICHRCDNRKCCNPAHLFLGTCKDNIADCARKGRKTRGEDHPAAHLTEEQVREIRRRHGRKWGSGSPTLAREFGVNPAHILQIVHRKKWAWLTDDETSAV